MDERKPFDAAVRQLLDEQAAQRKTQSPATSPEAKLQQARAFVVQALKSRGRIAGLPNAVQSADTILPGGLSLRLYRPAPLTSGLPLLVYAHGGGWSLGSVQVFDPFCRLLCEAAKVMIVSVQYRLAPEHPYPAGLEDVLTAFRWTRAHAEEWGGDVARIALGGDSAGANLAAVSANLLCEQREDEGLRAQMLLYPVTDDPQNFGHASYAQNASGYGLEASLMHWFWDLYAPNRAAGDPRLSPLRSATIPRLPPTLIATAEYDVLRDEGIAYAEKLASGGVSVSRLHSDDMGHNFPASSSMVGRFPQSQQTLREIAAWLSAALSVI